jgi:DNA-directed RNA polymerase subunit L
MSSYSQDVEQSSSQSAVLDTYISARDEVDGTLTFTLAGINVSIANGLRRTILSDIPVLAFKTFPHNENQAEFITNTSRFNNEILKQRLGCIPIHIPDLKMPYNELLVEIHKKNDTNEMMYLTTQDFKVKNISSDKYLDESTVRKIFPPDPITNDFLLFARLRPKISNEVPGEEIKITAKMSVHTAGEDGMYNTVSCCTYFNTPDKVAQKDGWQNKLTSFTEEEKDPEVLTLKEMDYYNHDAKRFFIKDSFDFKIETIGVLTNYDICSQACQIIIEKLLFIKNLASEKTLTITKAASTIENCFEILLDGFGYTVGKIIEYVLHRDIYAKSKTATYVGFRKNHPHDSTSFIRIGYKSSFTSSDDVKSDVEDACEEAIKIYSTIASEFEK